jgi:hypothetical protein
LPGVDFFAIFVVAGFYDQIPNDKKVALLASDG